MCAGDIVGQGRNVKRGTSAECRGTEGVGGTLLPTSEGLQLGMATSPSATDDANGHTESYNGQALTIQFILHEIPSREI
ncbi:unnamed protein product [Lasius platythorax]|uniref:Uncharacterized protein n=1 Tax=Lasius platythorax TaxID=488582 RepID=A0AAV2N6V9_9HYME